MKIEKTSLDKTTEIFMTSEILKQSDHGGMRITELNHTERGKLTLIQGGDDGVLIIQN